MGAFWSERITRRARQRLAKANALSPGCSRFPETCDSKESLIKCVGGSLNKIREIPSLPLNGIKTYKGKDYYSQTFIYDHHIVSITLEGNESFDIDIKKVEHFPFVI